MGLYEALQKYDPDVGNHFMKFKDYEVKRALYDELPLLIPGYTIQNDKQHRRVKKTMGVYRKNADLPYAERITALSEEIQLTEKHAKEILLAADLNSNMEPLTKPVVDADGNETEEEWIESPDPTPEQKLFLDLRDTDVFLVGLFYFFAYLLSRFAVSISICRSSAYA